MRLLVLFLIATFLQQMAFTQTDSLKPKNKKFLIGLSGGPNYGYRYISQNPSSNDPNIKTVIDLLNNSEVMNYGFSAGIDLEYLFSKHFSIRSGVNYNKYTTKTNLITYVYNSIPQSALKEGVSYYGTSFLEIPAKISYRLSKGKINFHGTAGFGFNIFLFDSYYVKTVRIDGVKQTFKSPNRRGEESPVAVNAIAGLGLDYKINKRMLIRLEPAFKFMISPLSNSPILTRLYSYNLNISILFKL